MLLQLKLLPALGCIVAKKGAHASMWAIKNIRACLWAGLVLFVIKPKQHCGRRIAQAVLKWSRTRFVFRVKHDRVDLR